MLTDEQLRDELTEAFRERAGTVTGARVLGAGLFTRARRVRERRRRVVLGAVSVTAAAAVAAGVLAVSGAQGARPAAAADRPPGVLLDAAMVPPPAARAADAGMPEYYVIASHSALVADVRESATGAVLSTVALPGWADPKLTQVAAAGGDRTFVLALAGDRPTVFDVLRVSADGQAGRLSTLRVAPLPAGASVNGLALSPDGRELAVAVQLEGGQRGELTVLPLAGGAARTWTSAQAGMPWSVSWAEGGRELGFFWQDADSSGRSSSGFWVLNVAARGHGLLSGRRVVPGSVGSDDVQSALLTPDGSTVIASVSYDGLASVGKGTVVGGIVALSARTGHVLRTLLTERAPYSADPGHAGYYSTPCSLGAVDATGQHLLVSCDSFGRLDRGRFTPLPGVLPQLAPQVGW
jgi:CTP:molybdopterin cytidylyltransferase MocA